jgi:hypothetical protein
MHAHNVFFWLRNDLDGQALAAFEQGLNALTKEPTVKSGYYGKAADTQREVVDNSYTYALVLVFDDLAGHDRYQAGAVHREFIEEQASNWERLVVYDIQTL